MFYYLHKIKLYRYPVPIFICMFEMLYKYKVVSIESLMSDINTVYRVTGIDLPITTTLLITLQQVFRTQNILYNHIDYM